jgi:hypothetical protein
MDPVTLLVTALVAGAGAGLKDAAGSAVRDAYNGLRAILRRRFAGKPAAEVALAEHEQDPQTWEKPLRKELTETGADGDAEALELAQRVLALVDQAGSNAGKYIVDARYAQRFQIGEHNVQTG